MWLVNEVNEGTKDAQLLNDIFIGRIKPWAEFEPTSPWLLVGCDNRYMACTQAGGWSKKPEFVMRWPFWIRAARSGPGWGLTKRARGGGGKRAEKHQLPLSSTISWRPPVDAVSWLVDILSINTRFNIQIIYCSCHLPQAKWLVRISTERFKVL